MLLELEVMLYNYLSTRQKRRIRGVLQGCEESHLSVGDVSGPVTVNNLHSKDKRIILFPHCRDENVVGFGFL